MAILLPSRFNLQPQYAAPIDYQGLGKGMQLLFNPALGAVDLVTGRAWAQVGDLTIQQVSRGKVFNYPGVEGALSYTGYPEITGTRGTFFVWCPTVGPKDDWGHNLFGDSSTFYLAHQYGNFYSFGSESSSAISGWFNTVSTSLVCSSAGATAAGLKVYKNGVDTGLAFVAAPAAWTSGAKNLSLGKFPGGVVHDFNGTIRVAGYTTEVWGAAEAKAFHENPWQIFKAPARRIWAVGTPSTDAAGSASGFATVSGVGTSAASTVGSSAGFSTVIGVSDSGSTVSATGSAAGLSAVSGIGAADAPASTGSAIGSASVLGVGASTAGSSGSASGSSSVIGVSESTAPSAGGHFGGGIVERKRRERSLVNPDREEIRHLVRMQLDEDYAASFQPEIPVEVQEQATEVIQRLQQPQVDFEALRQEALQARQMLDMLEQQSRQQQLEDEELLIMAL